MSRGRKKQNRMAKFSITCMVCLLIILMSTQIVKLYHKNQELAVREASYEEQKREEEARQQELEETFKSRFSTMESDIVDAVISVFDKVFQIQFEDKRELLLALVNGTLMDIDPGEKIRIHVNFEDQKMLSGHIDEIQEITGKDVAIEFVKDQKLSDGQCKIETDYGVVDCGIDTQLSSLLKDIRSLCR